MRWGIPGRLPIPTSPSHRCAMGPSLSPLKGGEGKSCQIIADPIGAWIDFNRGTQQIREWLYGGLAINGVMPDDIPPDVEL